MSTKVPGGSVKNALGRPLPRACSDRGAVPSSPRPAPARGVREDKEAPSRTSSLCSPPVFPLSRAPPLSLFLRLAETLGRAAVRHCRRSEPPPTNRRDQKLRLDVLFRLPESRLLGSRRFVAIVGIPRRRRQASSSIPSSPASLRPRRPS